MSAEQDAFWMDELIQHVSTPRFVRVSLAPGRNNARHTAKYTHVYVLLNTVNVQGLGLIVSTSAPPFFYFVRLRNKIIFELVNSTQMSMTCCADSSGRFMCELLLLVRSHSHFFRSQGRRNQTDGVFFFFFELLRNHRTHGHCRVRAAGALPCWSLHAVVAGRKLQCCPRAFRELGLGGAPGAP
jgi:hypothetical protein